MQTTLFYIPGHFFLRMEIKNNNKSKWEGGGGCEQNQSTPSGRMYGFSNGVVFKREVNWIGKKSFAMYVV